MEATAVAHQSNTSTPCQEKSVAQLLESLRDNFMSGGSLVHKDVLYYLDGESCTRRDDQQLAAQLITALLAHRYELLRVMNKLNHFVNGSLHYRNTQQRECEKAVADVLALVECDMLPDGRCPVCGRGVKGGDLK
jgi:hypothetical protein